MTKNQIEFNKLLETKRMNEVSAALKQQEISNDFVAKQLNLQEAQRHNKASESVSMLSAQEAQRHNVASEQVSLDSLSEQKRSNLARESEQARSNRAQEALSSRSLDQSKQYQTASVGLGYSQVGLGYSQLAETQRSNIASEGIRMYSNLEQSRANKAKEAETTRHNVVSEAISRYGNSLAEQRQSEQVRHNKVSEVSMFIDNGVSVAKAISSIAKGGGGINVSKK